MFDVLTLSTNFFIIVDLKDAPTKNRTQICTVAGYYSTTRPLVLITSDISITYSYFRHAVLPNYINLSFTNHIKRTNFFIMVDLQDAPAENQTRVCTDAGYYSTTRPLVLLPSDISILLDHWCFYL